MRLIDLTNKLFGSLLVLHREVSKKGKPIWVCRCVCGAIRLVPASNLSNGHTRSCGCVYKHGMTHTPTYSSWTAINSRCRSESNSNFKHYGSRGISVCGRWQRSFEAFLKDMGERPSLTHTIDRIDNDGNYEPGNCRWATRSQQRKNQRPNTRGRLIEFSGLCLSIKWWAIRLGIDERTLGHRIRKGWPIEKALTHPVSAGKSRGGKASQLSRRKQPFCA